MVFVSWTTPASGQGAKDAAGVAKEAEKYMPLLKGEQWQKLESNSKVAFIWGAAHVILLENVLMEQIPELRTESFSAKVFEARRAKVSAGTAMTINQIISAIDQYYKDHPDQIETDVLRVIWNVGVKPNLKTGIAGRPLK
jgi:predicted GTPase